MEYDDANVILTTVKNSDGWFGIDYNINLYRGCNHGCIYCDSRSKCYNINNFDSIRSKKDALIILEKELIKKKKKV